MIVKSLLKYLFTWWNGSTVGTNLYTFLKGKKVGEDHFGNYYYESKDKKNLIPEKFFTLGYKQGYEQGIKEGTKKIKPTKPIT